MQNITIDIFHNVNPMSMLSLVDRPLPSDFIQNPPRHVATLSYVVGETQRIPNEIVEDGKVEVDDNRNLVSWLESAFHDTNHIDHDWTENDSVSWVDHNGFRSTARSTSVADYMMVKTEDTIIGLFRVDGVGYTSVIAPVPTEASIWEGRPGRHPVMCQCTNHNHLIRQYSTLQLRPNQVNKNKFWITPQERT